MTTAIVYITATYNVPTDKMRIHVHLSYKPNFSQLLSQGEFAYRARHYNIMYCERISSRGYNESWSKINIRFSYATNDILGLLNFKMK